MKITKYAQFTYIVENNENKRILIDPGKYNYSDNFTPKDFGKVDILIITHKHGDHHDIEAEKKIIELHSPLVYTNYEIAEKVKDLGLEYNPKKVEDVVKVNGFKITFIYTDHFAKGEVVENFGLYIEADSKSFYHTSDTRFMEKDIFNYELVKNSDVLTLPISNRGVVMGIEDAIVFTSLISPDIVIPAHYDSPKDSIRVKPIDFKNRFEHLKNSIDILTKTKVKILNFGETLVI